MVQFCVKAFDKVRHFFVIFLFYMAQQENSAESWTAARFFQDPFCLTPISYNRTLTIKKTINGLKIILNIA